MKIKIPHIFSLFDIPLSVSEDVRRQRLLYIIAGMIGTIALILLIWAVAAWQIMSIRTNKDLEALITVCVIMIVSTLVIFILNRFRSGYFARILFVALLFLVTLFDTTTQMAGGRTLLYFSLPIIAAAILIRPSASFILALISAAIVEIAAHSITPALEPLPSVVALFLLATFIWMATSSLERHIEKLQEANAAFKESEERYRALVEISPDMVVLSDIEGKIVVVNQAGLTLFGYANSDEVVGKKIWEFIVPDDQSRAIAGFGKVLENGAVTNIEYCALNKKGNSFTVELSASVLKDPAGQPQAVLSVGRDVTLRKKMEQDLLAKKEELESEVSERTMELRQTNERLDELVVRSPTVIYNLELSENHALTFISENVYSLLGYTDHQFVDTGNFWARHIHPDDQQAARIDMSILKQTGTVTRQYRFLHNDGSYRWIRDEVKEARDRQGNPLGLVGSWVDTTPQKQTEEAYQALVNNSVQGLVLLQTGRIILTNMAFANSIGLTPEEIYTLPEGKIFDFIHPDDRDETVANLQNRLAGKPAPARYEIRLIHKNGTVRWLEILPIVITLDGIQTTQITTIDITERKNAEDAMQAARDQLEATLNTLPDILFELDRERRFCSFRAMRFNSFFPTHETFLGKTVAEAIPEEAARIMSAALDDALLHGQHRGATYDIDMPVGKYSFELSISTMGDMNLSSGRFIMLVRDITERKQAEEALRESEKRYRDLFENASLAVFQSALDGKTIAVNSEFAHMFGYQSPEDFKATVKDAAGIFVDPQRRAEIIRLRAENPGLNKFENNYLRKNGSTFIGQLTVKSISDANGRLQYFEGFIEDITSRKQTEIALRESEERYRTLAEAAQDMIIIVTLDDQIAYVNQFAAQLVGMTPEQIIGLPRSLFFPPDINDRHQANLRKVVEHGLPMFTESRTPFPTGAIWLSNWLVPLKDESGTIKEILAISRDITERKALEESLLEAKNSLEQRVVERTADLTNSREQLRELTRQTVSAQENERRRLSRELHDEAGQALIGLKFSLDEILAETPESQENTRRKISKTMARADDLNRQIRNLAHGLHPPILDVAGIDLALKGFCREFSEETHFPVTYSGTDDLPGLSDEISITLYRFTQEAITNVIKHAHASEARVSLHREAGSLTLSVKDNGSGFDTVSTPKGIGLLGMEERLGLLGGRLVIKSGRKRGTHLKAIVPLAREELGL